jgi:cytochrome c oxidase subunit 2
VKVDQPGDYYGECNQICGTNHSMMPISLKALPPEAFTAWVAQAKTKFSDAAPAEPDEARVRLAAAAQ